MKKYQFLIIFLFASFTMLLDAGDTENNGSKGTTHRNRRDDRDRADDRRKVMRKKLAQKNNQRRILSPEPIGSESDDESAALSYEAQSPEIHQPGYISSGVPSTRALAQYETKILCLKSYVAQQLYGSFIKISGLMRLQHDLEPRLLTQEEVNRKMQMLSRLKQDESAQGLKMRSSIMDELEKDLKKQDQWVAIREEKLEELDMAAGLDAFYEEKESELYQKALVQQGLFEDTIHRLRTVLVIQQLQQPPHEQEEMLRSFVQKLKLEEASALNSQITILKSEGTL